MITESGPTRSGANAQHYECRPPLGERTGALANDGTQRIAADPDGTVYSATRSAKNPLCRCGESRPEAFARKARRNGRGARSHTNGWSCDWPPTAATAHHATTDAIRRGWLKRGKCFAAGPDCKGRIEGHHHDYAKPLAVVWCCLRHHKALDQERRAGTPLDLALVNAVRSAGAWALAERAATERRAARKAKAAQLMALLRLAGVAPQPRESVSQRRKRRVSRTAAVLIEAGKWPKIGKLRRIA